MHRTLFATLVVAALLVCVSADPRETCDDAKNHTWPDVVKDVTEATNSSDRAMASEIYRRCKDGGEGAIVFDECANQVNPQGCKFTCTAPNNCTDGEVPKCIWLPGHFPKATGFCMQVDKMCSMYNADDCAKTSLACMVKDGNCIQNVAFAAGGAKATLGSCPTHPIVFAFGILLCVTLVIGIALVIWAVMAVKKAKANGPGAGDGPKRDGFM